MPTQDFGALFSNSQIGVTSSPNEPDPNIDPFGFPIESDDSNDNKGGDDDNKGDDDNNNDDELDFSALFDNVNDDDDDDNDNNDTPDANKVWEQHLESVSFVSDANLTEEDWEKIANRDVAPIRDLVASSVKKAYQMALVTSNKLMEQRLVGLREEMERLSEGKVKQNTAEEILFAEVPQLARMSKQHINQAKSMLNMGLMNGLEPDDAVQKVAEFFAAFASKQRAQSNKTPPAGRRSRRPAKQKDTVPPAWWEVAGN